MRMPVFGRKSSFSIREVELSNYVCERPNFLYVSPTTDFARRSPAPVWAASQAHTNELHAPLEVATSVGA